ncbi:glucokinase [Erythrobacteraceae bacterium CFH 75059]|uniref:glucokinase n=1 Tax=Qipengyuania thermophila TaxID=2509361 RepID=UPI00102130FC|nr:glucokinase [Qipengyuania thermophila]TCD04116.1 glucokinase [Erythrobacteraceae bacterium CFH 75059]
MTEVVAIDVGGTHARFARARRQDDGTIALDDPVTLHTADHASFETAWEDFRARCGGSVPRAVAVAVAGPVTGEVIRFTNNPWILRPAQLPAALNVDRLVIVNDFEAVAHAVAIAPAGQFAHLAGPEQPLGRPGTISVLGPGTGLGVAHLWRGQDGSYRVQATEGGHIDFAPLDPIEDALLARLRRRHTRVSVERVVSGPAIVDIHQALAAMEGRPFSDEDDVAIWSRGLAQTDILAAAAVDRFCLSLGSVAGDIALAQGGFAGVVIAGGLGLRLRDVLPRSGFASRFAAKGRFEHLMRSIPVKLITHPQPGLLGAAAAFFSQQDSE